MGDYYGGDSLTQECQRSCFWCWFGNCSLHWWSFVIRNQLKLRSKRRLCYLYGFPLSNFMYIVSNVEKQFGGKMCPRAVWFSAWTADQAFTYRLDMRWKPKSCSKKMKLDWIFIEKNQVMIDKDGINAGFLKGSTWCMHRRLALRLDQVKTSINSDANEKLFRLLLKLQI
jgi:hypothetical protein